MLANATRHRVLDVPLYDHRGAYVLLVIVKASFEIRSERVVPATVPSEIRTADVFSDPSNGNSSLLAASDVSEPKPLLDVIVRGKALPPEPTNVHDVAVRFRQRTVPLRVHGPRLFQPDVMGVKIGKALPFEEQEISYDLAFGGVSADLSEVELRNPAGRGVHKTSKELDGQLAPQIEHPDRPHRSPRDKHEPVGFGPIGPHWSPRREHFGNMLDERYADRVMPLMPTDFDPQYFQQAHPSLQFAGHLAEGEVFQALGMTREGLFSFATPAMRIRMRAIYDGRTHTTECPVDTLFVEPDEGRFEMVARGVFGLGRSSGNLLREVHVDDFA